MKLKANSAAVALGLVILLGACGGADPAPTTGPDLLLQGVTVNPAETTPGGTVEIEFTIVNAGDETAAASTTRISINQSGDSDAGSTQLRDLETAAITPGSSLNLSGPVTLPGLEEGDYFMWVTADVHQEAGQSDHSNDTATTGLTVTADSSTLACTEAGQVIDIPDANLAGRVRAALGVAEGAAIECQEMRGLTSLTVNNADVRSIEGLQHAINLTELGLERNAITEISPLVSLSQLSKLRLARNEINNITPLADLTELTELGLGRNSITDLTPLTNLTRLEWLSLGSNPVSDLTPLANLTNLWGLYVESADISDISALKLLVNLQELFLGSNQVTDLAPLAALTNLELLGLEYNEIRDLTPLANLSQLYVLILSGNQISDLAPLQNLNQLESLELASNQVSDLSQLTTLSALTLLRLTDNQITDLEPLQDLTNLETLRLDENQVADIEPLVRNTGIGRNDWIWLQLNCLDLTEGAPAHTHIHTIIARGATVEYTPQQDCDS